MNRQGRFLYRPEILAGTDYVDSIKKLGSDSVHIIELQGRWLLSIFPAPHFFKNHNQLKINYIPLQSLRISPFFAFLARFL